MPIRSSAQALVIRDEQVLTVVKTYLGKNEYILPGGGQEFGETLVDALKRECLGELGAKVRVEQLVTVREFISRNHSSNPNEDDVHIINNIFACTLLTEPIAPAQPDVDQIGIRWISLSELETYNFYPRFLISFLKSKQTLPFYLGDVNCQIPFEIQRTPFVFDLCRGGSLVVSKIDLVSKFPKIDLRPTRAQNQKPTRFSVNSICFKGAKGWVTNPLRTMSLSLSPFK